MYRDIIIIAVLVALLWSALFAVAISTDRHRTTCNSEAPLTHASEDYS